MYRWLTIHAEPAGWVTLAAASGAFSVLFSWYVRLFFAAGYAIPFATYVFDLREVAFAAWTSVPRRSGITSLQPGLDSR